MSKESKETKQTKQTTKKEKKFVVIHDFKDLQDNNRVYIKCDIYPAENADETSASRIEELSTIKNKINKVLIKEQA
ncbi:hypothetical protein [Bacillus cihuensis]|uniref:hypothetical protein n=1 Tax=Bacillus cihuensis TaxID=1208599 RepID=UPI000424E8F5|nr:hypothetical protein [Bacillus cihuensis]